MEIDEEVISLDLEKDSLLYRLRRGCRILYVDVTIPDLIPRPDRTESSVILQHLRLLPLWSTDWRTLTVTGSTDSPISCLNIFQPHSLQPNLLQGQRLYDITDFKLTERISDRVFQCTRNKSTVIIKIANQTTFERDRKSVV